MNRVVRLIALCILLSWPIQPVWADVVIYLKSQVTPQSEIIKVKHLAIVDGSPDTGKKIRDMVIEDTLLSDGLIDRAELLSVLRSVTDENIIIYGSATRVTTASKNPSGKTNRRSDIRVNRGDMVTVIVNNGGIVIETRGKVVNPGARGQRVEVELQGKKKIHGKVSGPGMVEVAL
jgi:flagella basal body P-ring formation protein FlgA